MPSVSKPQKSGGNIGKQALDNVISGAFNISKPPAMAFESLTDSKIQQLAKMPKRVKNPTARFVVDANHEKKEFLVENVDGTEQFRIFVRQNKTVTDDFSCGVQWFPVGAEPLILARFNGSSHVHPNLIGREYPLLRVPHSPHD